jgi:sulfur carrier protein
VAVNGRRRSLPAGGLPALLQELEITTETKGVAVAVNDELVPRADWAARRLHPGDRVEIVRAVQGG